MVKTSNEILTDVYNVINTYISSLISGAIYKNVRNHQSELEDCVISLISGNSGKFIQTGSISIKIFFPDVFVNDMYVQDTSRGQEIEGYLIQISDLLKAMNDYSFRLSSRTISISKVEDVNQHFVILRFDFETLIQ